MATPLKPILCDGCGRPASPSHIAERLARLELATRFRPLHMSVLFVALAPAGGLEDDFYGPSRSNRYFNSLMDVLEIAAPAAEPSHDVDPDEVNLVKLAEFQRRGFYQSYLAECPIPDEYGSDTETLDALGRALILRIRFNYRPKQIAVLGNGTAPLIEILEKSGMGAHLLLDQGQPLKLPNPADPSSRTVFRAALGTAVLNGARTDHPVSGYDRI